MWPMGCSPVDKSRDASSMPPRFCCWCLTEPATTRVIATDSCADCAAATPRERAKRWLQAVKRRIA